MSELEQAFVRGFEKRAADLQKVAPALEQLFTKKPDWLTGGTFPTDSATHNIGGLINPLRGNALARATERALGSAPTASPAVTHGLGSIVERLGAASSPAMSSANPPFNPRHYPAYRNLVEGFRRNASSAVQGLGTKLHGLVSVPSTLLDTINPVGLMQAIRDKAQGALNPGSKIAL